MSGGFPPTMRDPILQLKGCTRSDARFREPCRAPRRTCVGAVRLGLWFGLLDVDVEEPRRSDLSAFRQSKGVLNVDTEIPDRALYLRVPE